MNTKILSISAVAIGFVLSLIASAGAATPTATIVTERAALNYAQETPKPTANAVNAHGAFNSTFKMTSEGADFTWKLTFADLTGPATAAHLHIAARGEAGPVIVPLCGPCTNGQTGSGKITKGDISALRAGRVYVNIHTAQNPAGEVRGQVEAYDKFDVTMTPGQESAPKPTGNLAKAKGGFTAEVYKSDKGTFIKWRLAWTNLTSRVTAAHLHVGAAKKSGPVIFFLCGTAKQPCKNHQLSKVTKLTQAQGQALEAGHVYVNLHTVKNPAGEVRAQLRAARLTLRVQQ